MHHGSGSNSTPATGKIRIKQQTTERRAMHLNLLGTGCPQVDSDRFGPAALVRTDDAVLLFDVGSGVTQRLASAGTKGAEVDLLLLTHLHSDHVIDLYQLIVSSWHQGRERPQRIVGPPGTRAFVDATMALWREERELRIAHERRPSTTALTVEVEEIEDGWTTTLGGTILRAVQVDHQPIPYALGFIVERAGHKLAISGDTRYCPALIEAARGADLLLHECFVHAEMQPVPGVRSAETVNAVASYHTLSSEVGKVATEAGVAALALTHFVPTQFDKDALLAEIRADYAGPILVGEDLMAIDVAARSVRYRGGVIGY